MASHKDRLRAQQTRGVSMPRSVPATSSMSRALIYSSNSSQNVKQSHKSLSEHRNSDGKRSSGGAQNNDYMNLQDGVDANMKRASMEKRGTAKSLENFPDEYRPDKDGTGRYKGHDYTQNGYRSYMSMNRPYGTHSQMLYKSQSLNALKAKEPSKVLSKSTIQQEYHDKRVQTFLRGVTYGKARKPFLIASIMLGLFLLFFILGLTLICLTYIYKNITFSLDKGEMIGPVIFAFSFIFLGVCIKFMYDAYRVARKEKDKIAYTSYDHRYVGLKNRHAAPKHHEKLISGTSGNEGLTRVPNKIQAANKDQVGTGRSSQKIYDGGPYNSGSEL